MKSGKIQLLEEQTINQIAAGEVIEDPASVVKELVENAVDAGSKKIHIEIKGGGFSLIRVSDDGCGMSEEDALFSFQRFATSKLRKLDDLFSLFTMGFRGEALAAIGAIAKITLQTAEEGEVGTQIELEGGNVLKKEKCARSRGTTLEIRSLFYNVPARKKFQKSSSASSAEITRMVSSLALAHPEIEFRLIQQENEILVAKEHELEGRIQEVLGEEFLSPCSKVYLDEGDLKIRGLIGPPLKSRPNRTGQYLFINHRPVQSPLISYAVKDGYGTRLAEGRFPVFALHIHLAPELLDVNVHPQKKEVRIQEEGRVREKIQRAIFESLQGKEERPILHEQTPPFSFTNALFSHEATPYTFRFQETRDERENEFPLTLETQAYGIFSHYLMLNPLSVAGRVKMDLADGILLVDLQAAKSRLLFDSFHQKEEVSSQGLIFPITLDFSKAESQVIEESLSEITKIGIAIRSIGETSFIVEALPLRISPDSVKDFLTLFMESGKESVRLKKEKQLAVLAVRFYGQEKKKTTLQEALLLFEELLKSTSPYLCPLGKQTMIQVSCHEIEQLFSSKKTS